MIIIVIIIIIIIIITMINVAIIIIITITIITTSIVIITIISVVFSDQHGSLLRQQPRAAGVYLVDELHVAGESLQGLLGDAGFPQEHGEVIRA